MEKTIHCATQLRCHFLWMSSKNFCIASFVNLSELGNYIKKHEGQNRSNFPTISQFIRNYRPSRDFCKYSWHCWRESNFFINSHGKVEVYAPRKKELKLAIVSQYSAMRIFRIIILARSSTKIDDFLLVKKVIDENDGWNDNSVAVPDC